jgi:hypothetical protein
MDQKVETLSGMFNVHVVCDHVLFEIPKPMLNRDMLVNTEFAALSTGSDFVAPGSVVDNRVVRWVRRGNKIHLEDVRYEIWAPNMPNLQRGVESASLRSVIRAFDIITEGPDGAAVIDITDYSSPKYRRVSRWNSCSTSAWITWTRSAPSSKPSRRSRTTSKSASTRPGFPIAAG